MKMGVEHVLFALSTKIAARSQTPQKYAHLTTNVFAAVTKIAPKDNIAMETKDVWIVHPTNTARRKIAPSV